MYINVCYTVYKTLPGLFKTIDASDLNFIAAARHAASYSEHRQIYNF